MVCKIIKNGEAFMLPLDRAMLDRLGIDENTEFEVRTDGRAITFEPAEDAAKRSADLERFLKDTNDQYGDVLKRLAE